MRTLEHVEVDLAEAKVALGLAERAVRAATLPSRLAQALGERERRRVAVAKLEGERESLLAKAATAQR